MAGPGNTKRKDPDARRRSNTPVRSEAVAVDGEIRGPELPFGFDWPAQTRIWWDNWRRSAQSQKFTVTDWDFLLDTAMIHAEFWAGNTAVGSELRLRVAKLGATAEDRERLKIEVAEAGPPQRRSKGDVYGHLRSVNS